MQLVLQNAPILLQNAAGITKRVDYCKTRHNIKKKKCAFNQKALKNKTKKQLHVNIATYVKTYQQIKEMITKNHQKTTNRVSDMLHNSDLDQMEPT